MNNDSLKKYKRLYYIFKLDKLLNKNEYCFDDGQVESIIALKKGDLTYRLIKLNTNKNNNKYLTFAIIKLGTRCLTHQLLKYSNNQENAEKHLKELYNYIHNSDNIQIINNCYKNLDNFPRKNFFTKLFGF